MLPLEHRVFLESMVLHSTGGFTHQTLAHAYVATAGNQLNELDKVLQDCLALCQDLEQRGLIEKRYLCDGHFYFSH